MEPIGLNPSLGLVELIPVILILGLMVISLIDLSKKNMSGTPLSLWVLIICAAPLLGAIAYWIVKPTAENKN